MKRMEEDSVSPRFGALFLCEAWPHPRAPSLATQAEGDGGQAAESAQGGVGREMTPRGAVSISQPEDPTSPQCPPVSDLEARPKPGFFHCSQDTLSNGHSSAQ